MLPRRWRSVSICPRPGARATRRPRRQLMGETVLHVGGASPYDVIIGRGIAGRLPSRLGDEVQRVAFLYAAELAEPAETVLDVLRPHYDVLALGLPSGEQTKSADVAFQCWEA